MWVLVIPFAAFFAMFAFGAVALWFVAKRSKFSQTETQYGTAVHLETPMGTFDVHPEAKLDPRLSGIPVYPGALPENPAGADSVSQVQYRGRVLQEISASYWTPDREKQVWEFYREQLRGWAVNLNHTQGGRELVQRLPECVLLVRVSRRNDRTIIDTCVKPQEWPNVFGSGTLRN